MRPLSKTKILAFRQCPKRLWLEIHRPKLRVDSAATKAGFATGLKVGEVARRLYDPKETGALIDLKTEGVDATVVRSAALMESNQPVFEAGFSAEGALAFADIMLPIRKAGKRAWRMVEVKSSTSVKDYHQDDAAIQSLVARASGVALASIALAHIDSTWVYPGGEEYHGLLLENDLTDMASSKADEVRAWIGAAQIVAARRSEPSIRTGRQCNEPYACGFIDHCQEQEPKAEYPVAWLPRAQSKALKALVEDERIADMRHIPDDVLNCRQRRVKTHSLSGEIFFDAAGAAADLAAHKLPAYFLDFETIMFAVPIWKGTRPYQQIPFQFSVHRLSRTGKLAEQAFLDLSGNDPSKALAEALIAACGESGPVFAYNASFEQSRIRDLAERFPRLKRALLAINDRVVDLLKVAQDRYYHPSQQGSWSIKAVLPAVITDLRYDDLDGVKDGGMAMNAYLEAISPAGTSARKEQIDRQLRDYCRLDTYAMVRLWQVFAGRADLRL